MSYDINGTMPDNDLRATALPPDTLRILQLTDTHLYADPDGTLLGVNTLASCRSVIEYFLAHHWDIDLLLATGDLVHDASPEGYRQISEMLIGFDVPVFCLPGNHDVPASMHTHMSCDGVSTELVNSMGGWRFLMLNSVVDNSEGGRLAGTQLERLERALDEDDRHALVCMHHQPVKVGSAWIDTMAIENPGEFFAIIDRYPQVRGVLWGHIHQSYDAARNGVRLMASPSTCVQFAPHIDEFKVDEEPPGFRLLALLPDGRILSEVVRIDEVPQGLEAASSGY